MNFDLDMLRFIIEALMRFMLAMQGVIDKKDLEERMKRMEERLVRLEGATKPDAVLQEILSDFEDLGQLYYKQVIEPMGALLRANALRRQTVEKRLGKKPQEDSS